jgi:hypothetical protein
MLGRRLGPATLTLALLAGEAGAQASLKPELKRAAEARAMAQACRELRPELAEHIGQAFEGWWVRDSEVADAVHGLYFGTRSPEQAARQQAFEALQGRFLADAERSRASDPEAFAERCRRFIEWLEDGVLGGVPRPVGQDGLMTTTRRWPERLTKSAGSFRNRRWWSGAP